MGEVIALEMVLLDPLWVLPGTACIEVLGEVGVV